MASVSQSADVVADVAAETIPHEDVDTGGPVELDSPTTIQQDVATDLDGKPAISGDDEGEPTQDKEPAKADDEFEETGDDDGLRKDAKKADDGEEGEMLEFDFGGNKLEVPKDAVTPELAGRIEEFTKGTWATFTKGQQANVERTKTLDAREGTVAKLQALNGEALQTYSYGLHLRSEIEQLAQVNLQTLRQSDPDRAREISDLMSAKQAEFQAVIAAVGEQEATVTHAQQEETVRRVEEGTAYLNRHIKNFSSEKATTLVDYVVDTYSMPREQAERWALNPAVTRMAYKAMLFDRQAGANKRPASPPQKAKPVKAAPSRGADAGTERDPDKMSMGQLAKYLELGVA